MREEKLRKINMEEVKNMCFFLARILFLVLDRMSRARVSVFKIFLQTALIQQHQVDINYSYSILIC